MLVGEVTAANRAETMVSFALGYVIHQTDQNVQPQVFGGHSLCLP